MFYLFQSLHQELINQSQQNNPRCNFYENVYFKPLNVTIFNYLGTCTTRI